MRFEYLSTFLIAVEKGSLLRASKTLNLSVSTVSAHVNAVEKFFGAKLLDKSVDGVALTKAGELAFDHISNIIRQTEKLKATISKHKTEPIRVAFGNVPGISIFPKAIEDFKRENPSLEIYARIKNESKCIDLMKNGEVDIAMICYDDEQIDLRKYDYKLLGVDDLILAVKKEHPIANKKEITVEELKKIPLIGLSEDSGITKALKKALKTFGHDLRDLNFVTEVDSVSTQLNSVVEGLGAAITSRLATKHINSTNIKTVEITGIKAHRNIYLIYSKALVDPDAIKFANFLARRGAEILASI